MGLLAKEHLRNGLHSIFLPASLDPDFAVELVEAANTDWPDANNPYAFIVANSPADFDGRGERALVVETNDALKLRKDVRLVVAQGLGQADNESLESSFRAVVGIDYPVSEHRTFDLGNLAKGCLDLCFAEADAKDGLVADPEMAKPTEQSIRFLANAYEGLPGIDWQRNWYEHVNLGLRRLIQLLEALPDGETPEKLLKTTFRCFSLPRPHEGTSYTLALEGLRDTVEETRDAARKIAKAVEEYWSNYIQISRSIEDLDFAARARPADEGDGHSLASDGHSLASIDWSGFDQTKVGERGSPLLALAVHDQASVPAGGAEDTGGLGNWSTAFAGFTEPEFLSPRGSVGKENLKVFLLEPRIPLSNEALAGSVHLVDGTQVERGRGQDFAQAGSVHVVEGTEIERGDDQDFLCSPELSIELEVRDPAGLDAEACRGIALRTISDSGRSIVFSPTGDPDFIQGNRLAFRGRLKRPILINDGSFHYEMETIRLELEIDLGHELVDRLNASASCELLLLPPDGAGVLIAKHATSGLPDIQQHGPTEFDEAGRAIEEQDDDPTLSLSNNKAQRVIVWSARSSATEMAPTVNGRELSKQREGLWAGTEKFFGEAKVNLGWATVLITSPEGELPFSPIVAAALGKQCSTDPTPDDNRTALRGALEDLLATLVVGHGWDSSLGHMALPSDHAIDLKELVPVSNGCFLTPSSVAEGWSRGAPPQVPRELTDSEEANQFREAFNGLGVGERLNNSGDASMSNWVSRTSWLELAGPDGPLDAYLLAYLGLVEKAKQVDNPLGLLWASYPFSASIWAFNDDHKECTAVLLSPLHPLRLAWFANSEKMLSEAEFAVDFLGTLQSWDLPLLGPSSSAPSQMVAVPTDAGGHELFVGWSTLLLCSAQRNQPLEQPKFVGSHRFPAVSVGAVTEGAVRSAMSDYMKLHPYATTLTVDLASSHASGRSSEVDNLILKKVADEGLPGGVRVFDSLNRDGAIPRSGLEEFGRRSQRGGPPAIWRRYEPNGPQRVESNMRIVHDPALRLGIWPASREEPTERTGLIGPLPVRRFAVPHSPNPDQDFVTHSAALNPGHTPFSRALECLEGGSQTPSIRAQVAGGPLVADTTDWTVTGESLIPPAGIAQLLSQHVGENAQMLWEWNPPFLRPSFKEQGGMALGNRAYMSVARVRPQAKDFLKQRLGRALGRDATDEDADNVLRVLGTRGIGLSSLISRGGTHQAGGIGFYAVLRLMDEVSTEGYDTFVMPIDSCDQFLIALSGNASQAQESDRRADLLVIQLGNDSIRLTPIEIKLMGLNAANMRPFPEPGTLRKRDDGLPQLLATTKLLEEVAGRINGLGRSAPNSPESLLMANALAAFVEAAMRLSPHGVGDRGASTRRLQKVIDGQTEVTVGKPVLAYLVRTANADDLEVDVDVPDGTAADTGRHAEYIANPQLVLANLESREGVAIEEWKRLFEDPTPEDPTPEDPTPEDPTPEDPTPEDPTPEDPTPEDPTPEDPTPEDPTPEDPTPEDPTPEDPTPEDPTPEDPTPEDPTPEDPTPEDPTPEDPTPEDPSGGLDLIEGEGVKVSVGELVDSFRVADATYWPGNTALSALNVGVVGQSGLGKTQLVKALIAKLHRKAAETQPTPMSILILDYKGDFQRDDGFIELLGGKVLKPENLPLDVLGVRDVDNRRERAVKKGMLTNVIDKIFPNMGPVQVDRLNNALDELWDDVGPSPTMNDLLERYMANAERADGASASIRTFVDNDVFSSDPEGFRSFEDLLGDQVVVLDLKHMDHNPNLKNALVALVLDQFFVYTKSRTEWPEQGQDPTLRRLNSYLVVDEATNIMRYEFQVLEDLARQGRSFGVGVLLSSQYPDEFRPSVATDYAQMLVSWFIHGVPRIRAKDLNDRGAVDADDETVRKIKEQEAHEAYYISHGYEKGRFIRGEPWWKLRQELEGDGASST